MKKILSVLIILAAVFSVFSCGEKNREYDEYEVKLAAEGLIKKSTVLNDIYWGEGIGYYEDDNYFDGYYYPADPIALRDLGFETIDELKKKGLWIYGADMDGKSLYSTDLSGAVAIVMGSEGFGISRLVKDKCDFIVSIPLYGAVNSMNVSCASAIIFAEAAKQKNS
ncbi:MAG: hypothetical protein J6U68_01875 [Clostridia bacterium]|nr:hypothetical protein [Clostridia bacterium]